MNFRNHTARTRRHHDDPVGEIDAFEHRMGDENDRRIEFAFERDEIVVKLDARDFVQRGERLVHQEDRRPRDESAGDRDAHLHAAGQFARIGLFEAGETDLRQHLFDAGRAEAFETPASRNGSQTLSNTFAHGISVGSWKTKPSSWLV